MWLHVYVIYVRLVFLSVGDLLVNYFVILISSFLHIHSNFSRLTLLLHFSLISSFVA